MLQTSRANCIWTQRIRGRWNALFFAATCLSLFSLTNATAGGQSPERQELRGTVVEQRKYSVALQNGHERIEIVVPDRVPISQRLDRPQIDLGAKLLTQEIVGSSALEPGAEENLTVTQELPDPLGIQVDFAHENERRRLMSGPIKRFVRYQLLPFDPKRIAENFPLSFHALVKSVGDNGILSVDIDGELVQAELGNRDGQLGDRTIADLKPFESEIDAVADLVDGRWVAQRIVFRRIVDPLSREVPGKPRVLVVGDEVSLSLMRGLREKIGADFNLHHPAENCRGSENWTRLDVWLGPYGLPDRNWNAIVFNCGLGDLDVDVSEYERNVRNAVEKLEKTDARLIWATTTPVPEAWDGANDLALQVAQQRIVQLNQIAQQIMSEKGNIAVCDLWQTVNDQTQGSLAAWSKGRSAAFNYLQSTTLVDALAGAIKREIRQ